MKNKKKCLLSLILALCLSFALAAPAWATDTDFANDSQKAAIIDVLQYVESDKESFNLSNVNFEDIEIGSAINAYEYTEDGFQEIIKFYPLYYNSEIVALSTTTDDEHYQIETALANKIAQSGIENVAIIYDAENCYLYDGSDFILVFDGLTTFEGRALLFNSRDVADTSKLLLTGLYQSENLDYYLPLDNRASSIYRCNVLYITQQPYNNLCWAASTACITNYVKGRALTTEMVAREFYNSSVILDQAQSPETVEALMNNKYNLNYKYKNQRPSDSTILTNIKNNYPIYGSFFWYDSKNNLYAHGTTIFAIDLMDGYISVMDPITGAYTAYYNNNYGTYTYIPSYNATTFTLSRAICHDW